MSSSTELFEFAQFLVNTLLYGAAEGTLGTGILQPEFKKNKKKNRPAFWDLMPQAGVSIGTITTRQHNNYVQWDHYFSWMCIRTVGLTSLSPLAPATLFIKNSTGFQLLLKKNHHCLCWMISKFPVPVSGLFETTAISWPDITTDWGITCSSNDRSVIKDNYHILLTSSIIMIWA